MLGLWVTANITAFVIHWLVTIVNTYGLINAGHTRDLGGVVGHYWFGVCFLIFWIAVALPRFDEVIATPVNVASGLLPIALLIACGIAYRQYAPTSRPWLSLTRDQITRLQSFINIVGVVAMQGYATMLLEVAA